MMQSLLFVCLGGAAGAAARFLMVTGAGVLFGREFPWGTFSVNVLGSFAIGVLWVLVTRGSPLNQLAVVGFLGAFTTFSAFSVELLLMLESGRVLQALSYAAASVACCLLSVALGVWLARALST